MTTESRWLSTAEAAAILGVKPETLYAYVSRGMLGRRRDPSGRGSLFDRAEVARLAARTPGATRAGRLEVVIDTALTLLDPAGRLSYRGLDVAELARSATYEAVAELLWSGTPADSGPWHAPDAVAQAAREAVAALPSRTRPIDVLRVAVTAASTAAELRNDLRPEAIAAAGRALVAVAVDALARRTEPADESVAGRLWAAVADRPATDAERGVLEAALVLLADHELAASTLAVRVAASTRADPYLAVAAGLAVAGGPLHGAASREVERLLRACEHPDDVAHAVDDALRAGGRLPGFGHSVYRAPDPRAMVLLAALEEVPRAAGTVAIVRRLIELADRGDGPYPNVDLALGALVPALGLAPGTGELTFVIARIAGWLAHAIEEYEHVLRFRPRAVYTGPHPAG